MATVLAALTDQFSRAFTACGADPKFGQVVVTQRPDLGQFQCNGALPAAKALRMNPRKLAEDIQAKLPDPSLFAALSIDGPGFMNITLTDTYLAQLANRASDDPRRCCPATTSPRNVVMDFCGPNVAKPLHVGHLRSTVIGDCLQRLFRFSDEKVTSDIHIGDWGTQFGMLIRAVRATRPDLPYFDEKFTGPYPQQSPVTLDELEVMYPAANSLCESNAEEAAGARQAMVELQQGRPGYIALWKHFVSLSVAAVKKILADLDVRFDLWLGESDSAPRIPAMVERLKAEGHARLSEGAWVIEVGKGDHGEELPPLLLVKRDGGFLYATTDLATIEQRVRDLHAEHIVYLTDKRQILHFTQLFKAARSSGVGGNATFAHVAFGTVNGPDGKPFKTRTGGAVRLEELIAGVKARAREKMLESGIAKDLPAPEQSAIATTVGIAALKYADLMNWRESDYIFDMDKFLSFEGNTGPYLLYACVRIKSIIRKATEALLTAGRMVPPSCDSDRQLMLTLVMLPDVIESALASYAPHYLCDFVYRTATVFNQFYRDCHIIGEKDPDRRGSWLALARLALAEMELVLGLLGIKVPERM